MPRNRQALVTAEPHLRSLTVHGGSEETLIKLDALIAESQAAATRRSSVGAAGGQTSPDLALGGMVPSESNFEASRTARAAGRIDA